VKIRNFSAFVNEYVFRRYTVRVQQMLTYLYSMQDVVILTLCDVYAEHHILFHICAEIRRQRQQILRDILEDSATQ
jgi:deferrochelatase/peroxidase EfeB